MPKFDAKDGPLRDDVRRLGAVVGDMLREQEGEAFFEIVESTRTDSQAAREGDSSAASSMQARLSGQDLATREKLVRAFSAYFSAINMGEQIHRIRRRRAYEREGVQSHSPDAIFTAMQRDGQTPAQVRDALARLAINPVFTAHPTEAVRRSLLTKQQRIARALVDRIEPGALTPIEE
jgi:phosphoenolpyruvate carboxylase